MTEHKFCADLRLPDGYGLLAIVENEAEAVQKAIEKNAHSFRICEADVATPEDNVPWVLTFTTDYSGVRYINSPLYDIDGFVQETRKIAQALKASAYPEDQGTGDALETAADIFTKHRDAFNAVAFIRDPSPYARGWDFIPLKQDEKVFDKTGVQTWPAAPKP